MAVDGEGRDCAAEIDLGDAAREHDHRPDRDVAIGRHEGALQLQLGAVERALHASGEEGQSVHHIRRLRHHIEDQRVDLDADLPVAFRLVVLAVDAWTLRGEEMPARGDVAIAAAIAQHAAADQREGKEIGSEELPAREQVLQGGGGGFHT